MCELLIRVISKVNAADPYLDCKLTKRGDVIVIAEDGHPWQKEELCNPDWRILCIRGVSSEALSSLTEPERDKASGISRLLHRRAFKLDLDSPRLKKLIGEAWLDDSTRAAPMKVVRATLKQLLTSRIEKPSVQDPDVFDLTQKGIS